MSATTSNMNENEFTIRVTGAAPPPLSSSSSSSSSSKKKGGRGGKAKNNNATASQQQQRRYNLRLRPSTSLHQLRTDVYALFNIPSDYTNSYQISFLGGFPPTELDQTDKQTVHELGIRPNESYKVVFALIDDASAAVRNGDTKQKAAAVAGKKSNGESSAVESSTTTGRQKRASAMAATANFKDVIAAQDAIMKNEKKKSSTKKSSSVIAGGTISNIAGFGKANNASKRIATIGGGGGNNKAKKVKIEGGGYRLSDGKAFAGTSPSKKKKAANGGEAMFKSEDDVANKLLTSLSSGGGNVGKYLRTAMKGAVTKSYEASHAAVRVTAVNTGDYCFEKVKGGSVVDGGGVVLGTAKDHAGDTAGEGEVDEDLGRTLYTVRYSKGMEGRGRYDEQVEIIGLAALKSVLEHVYDSSNNESGGEDGSGENKDGRLRPVLIAQLSPRAFWSLVYHCSSEATQSPTTNISVEDMLRSTLPQLDWSHLERGGRKRVLSEKAKENLRQTTTQPMAEESLQNNEKGEQNAIEELGESILNAAMAGDEVDHGQELNERELRARAAMARFGSENGAMQSAVTSSPVREEPNVDNWMLVTPTDEDIDELVECIMEGAVTSEQYDEDAAKTWGNILLDNIQNWRVLANCNADDIISKLTGKDCPQPSSDIVQEWIDAAQVHTMEEIMLEILGGDQDALDLLQDKAKSSSPRDLVQWRDAPGMLADTLSSADETNSNWKRSDVMRWISRAEIALGVCTWLEDYTSHVKESSE